MISGEGTVLICRPPRDVLEFVLDLEQYRQADTKIGPVYFVERRGNEGVIWYSARVWGLTTPRDLHAWRLVPYTRLEIRSVSSPWPVERFEGLFTCEETAEGTRVLHRESFVFRPPVAAVIERLLGPWLARDVADEVARMKKLLESKAA
jgi:hypothetical protein